MGKHHKRAPFNGMVFYDNGEWLRVTASGMYDRIEETGNE